MRGDRALERMLGENRRIRVKVTAVRQLHAAAFRDSDKPPVCVECLKDYPCPTITAIDES